MSAFSEKLSFYVARSGMSLKSLSEASGIENTLLIKIRKGTRPAKSKEGMLRLMDALQLSVSDRRDLAEAWEIDQIGEEEFKEYLSIRTLLESMRDINSPTFARGTAAAPPFVDVRAIPLNTPVEVNHALHTLIESACASPDSSLLLHTNLTNAYLMNALMIAVSDHPELPVSHIVSFLPASNRGSYPNANIERLGRMFPLLFSGSSYMPYYSYEQDIPTDNLFLFPNVLIADHYVISASPSWNAGFFSSNEAIINSARFLFHLQLSSCKRFGHMYLSLDEQMQFFAETFNRTGRSWRYLISRQPCILPLISEDDAREALIPGAVTDETIETFFRRYRAIPLQHLSNMTSFFMLDGLRTFMDTGIIYEVPGCVAKPLPLRARQRVLRQLITASRSGAFHPQIVKQTKFDIPRQADVLVQGGLTVFSLLPSTDVLSPSCFFTLDTGMSDVIERFMAFLEKKDFWTYTQEESLKMIEDMLKASEG